MNNDFRSRAATVTLLVGFLIAVAQMAVAAANAGESRARLAGIGGQLDDRVGTHGQYSVP
jgi:hypothetical protein